MSKEELDKYLNTVRSDAVKALKNFLNNLDINPRLLEHIYNVEMVFVKDEIKDVYYPNYVTADNIIEISENDFIETINSVNDEKIDSEKKKKIYNNLVTGIIHEMLHANRTIMVEGGLSAKNLTRYYDDVSKKLAVMRGHDIIKYEELLFKMMDDEHANVFTQYIPIKAKKYENTVTVVAYDKINKSFVEFSKQRFSSLFSGDPNIYLVKLGYELNSISGRLFHKPTEIIYSYPEETEEHKENDDMIADASDYYHNYKPGEQKLNDITTQIDYQQSFEEIIAETLAYIIFMSRNDKYIDLDEISHKIILSRYSDLDTKVGAYLINKCGVDLLKWYMLSTYDFSYHDYFEKTFKDEYGELLKNMNILHEPNKRSKKEKKIAEREVLDIISNNETLNK